MPAFATVSDLRDTASFAKMVEDSPEPIQVMKGRERKMVVMSSELFERYERMERQIDFEARLAEAEADTAAGRTFSASELQQKMREKYVV
ncbi:MAG: hypothetical protein IJO87_07295 [Eggerthellaceae bacterium]|nr:hypothetical protein [Eggerthellaceae bacterium]